MSTRIDPQLMRELKEYGAVGIEKCFNCGNCTASCPLASDEHPFPRNMIRFAQMGLKDKMLECTDAWQCYYCGDCSETCPKGAEPGETMMAMRRWLTAHYDRSGHAAKLYTSEKALVLTILRITVTTLVLFAALHIFGIARVETDRVALNTFAPVIWVWLFVVAHFVYLGWRVFQNSLFMSRSILRSTLAEKKIPLSVYVSELKTFIIHYFSQKRWRDCDDKRSSTFWLKHLLFTTGYVTMLMLIVVLLWWFQTDNIYPIYHPQRWLGYYATIVLVIFSIDFIRGRQKKQEQFHRFSKTTDWLFPIFILNGAITGILVHIFRYLGAGNPIWAWPTYIMYVIHVVAMIIMLDTEVGIGKWMHMIYRPLALYLEAVKKRAVEEQAPAELLAPAD
ncbi:MAG: 4Fe-4S dicluster domain-containing protein [Anaerolineales bacterium]|nr:4Fe-4S dicluster domain-containing protein [Anaerolineales bacterium]